MSKRKRRARALRALRDRLAAALVARLKARINSAFDVGLTLLSTALGVRVLARVDDVRIQRTLWPWSVSKTLDVLADELAATWRPTRGFH